MQLTQAALQGFSGDLLILYGDTPLLRAIPEDWLERKKGELPIGRFGRVDEVAPAALLLASEEGSYFIGASLNMNGGDYMI